VSSRASRATAAALIALALLAVSAWRSRAADGERAALAERHASALPPRSAPSANSGDGAVESKTATAPPTTAKDAAGASLSVEVQLAQPREAIGRPLELRLRAREGAARPFDVTVREERPKQRFLWPLTLPVREPELPLRVELQGDAWCFAPGIATTTIARLDAPFRVQLFPAERHHGWALTVGTAAPIAGAELLHESGALLATSTARGELSYLRPQRDTPATDLLLVRAPGFVPAGVDEEHGFMVGLRPVASGGSVDGRIVAADGVPVAGARITPAWQVDGTLPDGLGAVALLRVLEVSRQRDVPALAVTSDADGRFALPWPMPCALRLRLDHRLHGTLFVELPREVGCSDAGHVTQVELRFPARVAQPLLCIAAGLPVAGASIEVITRDVAGERNVAAGVTDAAGRVTLELPSVEPLWALIRAARRAPTVSELSPLAAAPIAERRLELANSCAIAGTLTDLADGVPWVVQLRDGASRLLLAEAVVEAAGRFRFATVPTGRRVELWLTPPGAEGTRFLERTFEGAVAGSGDAAGVAADIELGSLPSSGR
jgi:hypothetical protein